MKIIYPYKVYIFIFSVIVLSLLSYWRVLTFHFWRDDWGALWESQHLSPIAYLISNIHPATPLEYIIFFKLFGLNPIYWNIFGITLRIFASLALGLMMWGFMQSKKIAILSSLFFATSYAGLETVGWLSSHTVPITIILICGGFYFWFKYKHKNKFLYFIFSIFLFDLAFLADPGRSSPIILLILIWEIFLYLIKKKGNKLLRFSFDILILGGSFLLILYLFLATRTKIAGDLGLLKVDLTQLKVYFNAIGNLLFGWLWFIKTGEFGGGIGYNFHITLTGGITILVIIITSLIVGIRKKSEKALAVTWLALWILILYFPNWIYNTNLSYPTAATSRYLGMSSVGLTGVMALLIGHIRSSKLVILLSTGWIIVNVFTSNRILEQESSHRSINIVDSVWGKVIADVPKASKRDIFLFTGDTYLTNSIIRWAGEIPWPYVVKTGIERADFPLVTLNYESTVDLVCNEDKEYRLPNIYAWRVEKRIIENTSVQERANIKEIASMKNCLVR